MEPKKYGRHVLLDLCGGTEESVRSMFPHLVLKDDGLWLDPHAAAALALAMDEQDARGPAPDLELLRQRRQEAGRGGWTWSPKASSGGPVLPIPFTARELAAFILAGDGMALYDQFDFGALADEGQLKPLPTEADAEAARSTARAAREAYRAAGKPDAHEAWRQAASATRAACWTVYYAGPGKAKRAALRASFIENLNAADREAHKEFEAALRDLGENADEAREVMREAVALRVEADAKFGRTDEGVRAAEQWLLAGAPPEHVEDHAEQPLAVVGPVAPISSDWPDESAPTDGRRSRSPRPTWKELVGEHIVNRQRAAQHATAKELYHALEAEAGAAESPFDKGTGSKRGSLVIRRTGESLALKTIQNNWQDLKTAATR